MQVVKSVKESAQTDVSTDQIYWASCNDSGPIAMHEPYKSNDILCKNTFGVKKVQPSKVELYLEVNA